MDFYIMLCLLPCLILASIMLYSYLRRIKRPRYVKDASFMTMANDGKLIEIAQKKSIIVTHKYINDNLFFYVDEE